MNDETITVSPTEKSPYGVHGWLLFFISASRFLAPVMGAGALVSDFAQIERDNPIFFASPEMVLFRSISWSFLLGVTVYTWWFTERLRKAFEPDSVDLAVRSLIGIAIANVAITLISVVGILGLRDPDFIVSNVVPVILVSGISCTVWVSYFKLSKRVQNTYGTLKRAAETNAKPAGAPSTSSIALPVPTAAAIPVEPSMKTHHEHGPRVDSAPRGDDHFFAMALAELDGESRNIGRWARLFSEADGQETVARARYLRETAAELKRQAAAAAELDAVRSQDEARKTEAEELRLHLARRGLLSEAMVGRRKDHLMQGHLDGTFTVRHPSGLTQRFHEEEEAIKWASEG